MTTDVRYNTLSSLKRRLFVLVLIPNEVCLGILSAKGRMRCLIIVPFLYDYIFSFYLSILCIKPKRLFVLANL